ncbi:hypothetical protein RJ639_042043 [Escallonia herrerae]|uniref:Uncharacterized protein n=1 Tax=Escallonia herrerae TaxID=1293975 RepID=A0AA88WHT1_9ASTE|nr:hypothetical protein RJ639_042043 [Escallonia herrerae]
MKLLHGHHYQATVPQILSRSVTVSSFRPVVNPRNGTASLRWPTLPLRHIRRRPPPDATTTRRFSSISASLRPLDLTEDNLKMVLSDARAEASQLIPSSKIFPQIFDTSVGMTGVAELAELDGPFVKISLKGRFWHERSLVLARLGNYLKQRIPEILEVDIEDEKQLDDSPANF